MTPAPAAAPTRRRASDDESPPAAAVLAGVGGLVAAIPGIVVVLMGFSWLSYMLPGILRLPFTHGGTPAQLAIQMLLVQGAVLAVGLPVLVVLGAIRLLTRRDRWMLIGSGLPLTLFGAWQLLGAVTLGGNAWPLLLLLGPAVAPLFALAPSVGRWLAGRPFRIA